MDELMYITYHIIHPLHKPSQTDCPWSYIRQICSFSPRGRASKPCQVLSLPGLKQPERKPDVHFSDIYITNGPTWQIHGGLVRERATFVSLYLDLPHTPDAVTRFCLSTRFFQVKHCWALSVCLPKKSDRRGSGERDCCHRSKQWIYNNGVHS